MKTLVITNYFPVINSGEDIFFSEEYLLLDDNFEVIPQLDHNSSLFLQKPNFQKVFIYVFSHFKAFLFMIKAVRLINLIQDLKYILRTLQAIYLLRKFDNTHNSFYTYWCGEYTLALSLLKKYCRKDIKIITRVHGVDYIKERHSIDFFMRLFMFKSVDNIIVQCNWAKNYLSSYFKSIITKLIVIPIGVHIPIIGLNFIETSEIKFASCSNLISLKRVDLIIKTMINLASNNVDKNIIYNIIGDGTELDSLKRLTKSLPKNLVVNYKGAIHNTELQNYYINEGINYFIHLSKSEGGIPLSVQEALSCGMIIFVSESNCLSDLKYFKGGIFTFKEPIIDSIVSLQISQVLTQKLDILNSLSQKNRDLSQLHFSKLINSKKTIKKINEAFNYNN